MRNFLSVNICGHQKNLDIKVMPDAMIWRFTYGNFFLQFSVIFGVHCVIRYPSDDASQDKLDAYYRHHLYTVSNILCLLLFHHHIVTSRRTVNRDSAFAWGKINIHLELFFALFSIDMHADIVKRDTELYGAFKCYTGITCFSAYSPDNSASCWPRRNSSAHCPSPETQGVSRILVPTGSLHEWLR